MAFRETAMTAPLVQQGEPFSRSQRLGNGAAADHHVTVVEHHCLAGSDGSLGGIEFHPGKAVFLRINRARLLELTVPGFDRNFYGLFQGFKGIPAPVVCPKSRGEEGFIWANGNGILSHILAAHIHRRAHGKPQVLALTLGVAGSAPVTAYHIAL